MANTAKDTTIRAVRTFADDMQRVRGITPAAQPVQTPAEPIQKPSAPKPTAPVPAPVAPAPQPVHVVQTPQPTPETHPTAAAAATPPTQPALGKLADDKKMSEALETITLDATLTANHKPSILSQKSTVFDTDQADNNLDEGTIVTDKKRERFNLFAAILSAISGWFRSKQEQAAAARQPKHTVVKASQRKNVIEAASRQAQQAPPDDHEQVRERLKDVERITTPNELRIKDAAAAPTSSWTYVDTEDVQEQALASLEEAVQGDAASRTAEQSDNTNPGSSSDAEDSWVPLEILRSSLDLDPSPSTQQQAEANIDTNSTSPAEQSNTGTRQYPTNNTDYIPEAAAVLNPDLPLPAPVPRQPQPVRKPTPPRGIVGYDTYREHFGEDYRPREDTIGPRLTPAEQPTASNPETTPRFTAAPVPDYRLNRQGQPIRQPNNILPIIKLVGVIIVASILGVGVSVWWFTRDTDSQTIGTPAPTATLVPTTGVTIELQESRIEFYEAVLDRVSQTDSTPQEFYPALNNIRVSASEVFRVLEVTAPGSFVRAITRITFGGYDGSEPFIVMKFTTFDTVFGGILSWERGMYRDLYPLFSDTVPTDVTDTRVNNRDVRVLLDSTGVDVITYGFTDKNTLLITSTRDAYAAIAPTIQ